MEQSYIINTLHREKFMLCLLALLFLAGGLSAWIPLSEIAKIIIVLCTIPLIMYVSVKVSLNTSQWTLTPESLEIAFKNKTVVFPLHEIDHIRSLTRSGGNLYVIYRKRKSTKRYWRNKLFQADDDQNALQQALLQSPIEFHRL